MGEEKVNDEQLPLMIVSRESPTLGSLAAALAKAQGEMENARKESLNPHFNRKYADLAANIDAAREPLSKNGLAIVQRPFSDPNGVGVRTRLIHASGEWMESELVMPVAQRTAQGVGASLTYARRYSFAAMVGIAPEDDDGETADGRGQDRPQQSQPSVSGTKTAQIKDKLLSNREARASKDDPDAWALIKDLLAKHNFMGAAAAGKIKLSTGKTDRAALTVEDYEKLKSDLEAGGAK